MGIKVLSLFDGISCGQVALERAGIEVDKYYASEIDKYAIKVTQKNYPNTVQLGDVTKWRDWDIDWSSIDLLIGGSPCQGFSFAGKQLNFEDFRSKLFFEYVDILNYLKSINPNIKFLLENVKMKKDYKNIISAYLETEPIEINSSLVSAQNRIRLYWSNIQNIEQPVDKCKNLYDVLEYNANPKYYLSKSKIDRVLNSKRGKGFFYVPDTEKIGTLISGYYKQPTDGTYVDFPEKRMLTPTECEKLQTLPINYSDNISDSQRYKCIGNGWTVDVIAHIFKSLKEELR